MFVCRGPRFVPRGLFFSPFFPLLRGAHRAAREPAEGLARVSQSCISPCAGKKVRVGGRIGETPQSAEYVRTPLNFLTWIWVGNLLAALNRIRMDLGKLYVNCGF